MQAFEREFTEYCGAEHGIGCSNGTDALTLAIGAFDFERGFEAIVPSHTFFATVESVVHAGGVPVMVDIDPKTYTLDPVKVGSAITDKTKVIIPVHIYGQCADMDPLLHAAGQRDIVVIEDAAQAHGATYKGKYAGSVGDAASFSFYFTKNLGAFGEAGFVTANSDKAFERLKLLRHHGHTGKFEHDLVGYNMRIDELQAAVLRHKLPGLDARNATRRDIADRYNKAFAPLGIVVPEAADYAGHNYHCYVIQCDRRDELVHHLSENRIGTGIHYKRPVHFQPAMKRIPHRAMPMPVTESVCSRCVTLPCFPELSDEQVSHVIDSVRGFMG